MTAAEPVPKYPWHTAPPPVHSARHSRPGIQGRRAGLVTRALANVMDVGVVVLLLSAAYVGVTAARYLVNPASFTFPSPSFAFVVFLGMGVQALYFIVSWAVPGRTYGDAVLGLRVVNFRGERMRWAGALLRALLCVVFPIGLLWVLVSGQNRSVQDVLLRTSVIYDWPSSPVTGASH
ncbi:MAG TPA: RDD family protein [Actinomycetales bacterium]|nr:RDD family protein [Actinomycetales bacterium]